MISKMSLIGFKFFLQYLQKLCRDIVSQRQNQQNNHKDILNNLIDVSKINPDMTEEILYKTTVQFFGDGYESASQVTDALFINDSNKTVIDFFSGFWVPYISDCGEP